MSEIPRLRGTVGPGKTNYPEDIRLLRRYVNNLINQGYLPQLPRVTPEGGWDNEISSALQIIENTFFYGKANPDNKIDNTDTLFNFLVQSDLECRKLAASLSNEVYMLASAMVPGGIDRIKRTVIKKFEWSNGKQIVRKEVHETRISGNIRSHLPHILTALTMRSLNDTDMLMMALATIRAESATFRPIDERISEYNTTPIGTKDRHPFDKYDFRPGSLGNNNVGDGALYKGRGFIQLTGRANYEQIGKQIGVNLAENPDQANEGPVAAAILAQFLKNKEHGIRSALKANNLVHARKIVNGGSHGITEFTAAFTAGRKFLGITVLQKAKATTTQSRKP